MLSRLASACFALLATLLVFTVPVATAATPTVSATTTLGSTPYIGAGTTPITVTGQSPAGITQLWWASDDGQRQNWSQGGCTPSLCDNPPATTVTKALGAYDSRTVAEGHHTVDVYARQYDHSATTLDVLAHQTLSFSVDRTGPGIVPWFSVDFDSDTHTTYVAWLPVTDPALADGTPGSGVKTYIYSYAVNGGAFSAPVSTTQTWFTTPAPSATDTISLRIQTIDGAGNLGVTSTATLGVAKYAFDPAIDDDTLDGDGLPDPMSAFAVPTSAYKVHTTWHCSNGDDFVMRVGYDDNGKGFGYEHIRARRGYDDDTDKAIKETLCDPDWVKSEGGHSYTYLKMYPVDRAINLWRVTYQRIATRYDGHSKGVITAVPIEGPKDIIIIP